MKSAPPERSWPVRPVIGPNLGPVIGLAGLFLTMAFALVPSMVPATAVAQQSKVYETVSEPKLKPGMEIPEPTGPVVLTVSGRIKSAKPVHFDLAMLESLGLIRFTTPTSWTTEPATFEGVLLSALLDVVGPDPAATSLKLIAHNDFESPAPIEDGRKWPVMLALKRDGEYMSRRDRGPVWMVYPQHAYPELGQREYFSRWVWQLKAITVE
jgi:hypothetical protein